MDSEPIIELRGLSKSFETKEGTVRAAADVSLTVYRGEIFGIIGSSGAGKSTLVRCINFLERPTGGEVYFRGRPLSKMSEKELREVRRRMSMIFQHFNLLMQRTVLDNVAFPLLIAGKSKAEAKKKAAELLEQVGLAEKANAYPASLSGGQKQRVAIARALATDPEVLLCDEATSALDPETTSSVLALLRELNRRLGITVIVITHEMRVVQEICHRVAILDKGGVAETGTVRDVFTSPQTAEAKRLVFPESGKNETGLGSRRCRVVFDGSSAFEPVVAGIVLESRCPVNILFADTKNIDGKAYGQMILQLPADDLAAERILNLIRARGLTVEEADDRVD